MIKEYQRLKEVESNKHNIEWNVRRILSKANYHIHTDAIKEHIIPKSNYPKDKQWVEYAEEADLLNVALFGCTAKEWKNANPQASLNGKNIRDFASINELAVLSNLESINALLIKENLTKDHRFFVLSKKAKEDLERLNKIDIIKSVKKLNNDTYINLPKDDKKDEK